jgi:uncharacterized protein involved in outer membrane biogenesis
MPMPDPATTSRHVDVLRHPVSSRALRRLTWRPRSGFRLARRFVIFLAIAVILIAVIAIAAFQYFTAEQRVIPRVERFIASVTGGHVTVGRARIALTDGIEIGDLSIRTPDDQSLLLSARSLRLDTPLWTLLFTPVSEWRVQAIAPELFVVEDAGTGRWNFQSLNPPGRQNVSIDPPGSDVATVGPRRSPAPPLPQIILRGAIVHRQIIRDDQPTDLQALTLEGQLLPQSGTSSYGFQLQSRARTESRTALGPTLRGAFSLDTGQILCHMSDLSLDEVGALLPEKVRTFWQRLSPRGSVSVPQLIVFRRDDGSGFDLSLELLDGFLRLDPAVWITGDTRSQPTPQTAIASPDPTHAALEAIDLSNVRALLRFTDDRIVIQQLTGQLGQTRLDITGDLQGYDRDAPLRLTLATSGPPLPFSLSPEQAARLPAALKDAYELFSPQGLCHISGEVIRIERNGPILPRGTLSFEQSRFTFKNFAYPIQDARGQLILDRDQRGLRLDIRDVRGLGADGTANSQADLRLTGQMAPLADGAGIDITITGDHIVADQRLIDLLPSGARQTLSLFDPPQGFDHVQFAGGFTTRVIRPEGFNVRWSFDTDVRIDSTRGAFRPLKLPIDNGSAIIHVRSNDISMKDVKISSAGASMTLTGRTTLRDPDFDLRPVTRLRIDAENISADGPHRRALPDDAQLALQRIGLIGQLALGGDVLVVGEGERIDYDLDLKLHNGQLAPPDRSIAVKNLTGVARATSKGELTFTADADLDQTIQAIDLTQLPTRSDDDDKREKGNRPSDVVDDGVMSRITFDGRVDYSSTKRGYALAITSPKVLWNDELLRALDPTPREAARSLHARGPFSAAYNVRQYPGDAAWNLVIEPLGMSAAPDFCPTEFTNIRGRLDITDRLVRFHPIIASVDETQLELTGTYALSRIPSDSINTKPSSNPATPHPAQTVSLPSADSFSSVELTGTVVNLDPSGRLVRALPPGVSWIADTSFVGRTDVAIRDLAFSGRDESVTSRADIGITTRQASLDVGVKLSELQAAVDLKLSTRGSSITDLSGSISADKLTLAGLPADRARGVLKLDANGRILLDDLSVRLADGELAGQVAITRRAPQPSIYSAELLVRQARLTKLAAGIAPERDGRVNASLTIAGTIGDAARTTRGRGDLLVEGRDMVEVPMLLGLTQVVSLNLPFTGGFTQARASYALDGQTIRFDQVQLTSPQMIIRGGGWLDFASRQIDLRFHTDTRGVKLPIVGEFLDAARREMFQITLRGSLNEPVVGTGVLPTIRTSIDEVLGEEPR